MNHHRISPSRLAAALVTLILLAFPAAMASAHEATVMDSDPAGGATVAQSPAQVTAQFSEELDTQGSTMIVLDAAGHRVSDGEGKVDLNDPDHAIMIAALPAPLPDGVYTVQWHALLTDGDAGDGSFSFTVQTMGASAQVQAMATPAEAPRASAGPTVIPTTLPTMAPAAAQLEPDPPGQSPAAVRSLRSPVLWTVAASGGVLIVLGLTAMLWRSKR
jgi:methionine-rich copper-binding protein CopC